MKLYSPWAFWFLSLIPLVIIMYILKQKFEEKEVSSTQLWMQVLKDIEVNTPWQKLKKNILLLLQLLLIIMLIFALADPMLFAGGKLYSSLILVIDNTGSMNTLEQGTSRLELAKKQAEQEIKNSSAGTEITIIEAGRYPQIVIAGAKDKSQAVAKLRAIKNSKAAGNINDAVSIVEAMAKQQQSYNAVFYTDGGISINNNINARVINMAKESVNVSLDYISHSKTDKGIKTLLRISNRSTEALTREVSLYSGDRILDIMRVELEPNKTETVFFEEQEANANSIWAEITESDALPDDNIIYDVVKSGDIQRVLLVSSQNVFIEKALNPIRNIELYKTNPEEYIDEAFDLYIFDGSLPDKMPKSGSILLINPPESSSIIEVGKNIEGGKAEVQLHPITKYMENAYFTVSSMKDIEKPYWASTIINIEDFPAVIAGDNNGKRIGVIAFDLHNSDFVLTSEYPIFMYNLMEYLVGVSALEDSTYFCGEEIAINADADAQKVQMLSPSGKSYDIELVYPILPFKDTYEQGIYKLIQSNGEKNMEKLYAVNFPSEYESQGSISEEGQNTDTAQKGGMPIGRRTQTPILLIVLLIAVIEWVVYIRGY